MTPTSAMPWVKLYTEIIDDDKLGELDDATKWRFVQLVALAGELDAEGYLINGEEPMTAKRIAWRLRVPADQLTADLDALQRVGLVHQEDGAWCVTHFADRQGRPQSERREQWRNNKRLHRAAAKGQTAPSPECPKGHQEDNVGSPLGVLLPEGEGEGEEKRDSLPKNGSAPANEPKTSEKPPEEPRPLTPAQIARDELVAYFCEFSKIPLPEWKTKSDFKTAQKLWWTPVNEMLRWVDGDVERAYPLIWMSVERMRKDGLTLANPCSIEKTAASIFAELQTRSEHNGR